MAKKNVKEEIIQAARRLFNERGYGEVSMRDIADALSISVGNLTYHYPRKEDLIVAVVQDMHQYYQPPQTPTTLQELNAIFARIQNNIQQNAFYYWHYTQLAELSPLIRDIQAQVVEVQHQVLKGSFAHFAAQGLMCAEEYPGHFVQLAQAVQIVCVYWVPQSKLVASMDMPKDFLNCVWSVLLPCLTEKGKAIYNEKIIRVRLEEYERTVF